MQNIHIKLLLITGTGTFKLLYFTEAKSINLKSQIEIRASHVRACLSASAAPIIYYCVSSRQIDPSIVLSRSPPSTAKCIKGPFSPASLQHLQKDKNTGYAKLKPLNPSQLVCPSVHPLSHSQCQAKQSPSLQDTGLEKKALASGNQEQHPAYGPESKYKSLARRGNTGTYA